MTALRYAVREAVASLWRRRGASVLAVAAIGLAMLVLGSLLLLTSNLERVIGDWASGAEMSVFLRDEVTDAERRALEALLDAAPGVASRQAISKGEALERFRRDFADLAALAGTPDANPFPASIEVRLRPGAHTTADVGALASRLAAAAGVADVRYDRQWMDRVAALLAAVRRVGFGLALVMMAAAALTVAAVVRLALHARRNEIEIMQLVGSPYAFIRGPFVAEGVMQGGIGAVLAVMVLWVGFALARAWWGNELTAALGADLLRFLGAGTCALLVAGGMAVGGLGGFAASRTVS